MACAFRVQDVVYDLRALSGVSNDKVVPAALRQSEVGGTRAASLHGIRRDLVHQRLSLYVYLVCARIGVYHHRVFRAQNRQRLRDLLRRIRVVDANHLAGCSGRIG